MSESAKAVLALVVVIGVILGALAWLDGWAWWARAACPMIALGAIGILVWAQTRKDKAPDFLAQKFMAPDFSGRSRVCYFERDGFCFAFEPVASESQFRLDVYFQNRFERHCRAQVLVEPSEQFFLNRRPIAPLAVEIECEGGAYGVAKVPFGVPARFQGMEQLFDVSAHVDYPSGRGAMIRFRDGFRVFTFKRDVWSILQLLGALIFVVLLKKPAKLELNLPQGVAETIPENSPIWVKTLWRPSGTQ